MSVEQCEGDILIVTVFEIKSSEVRLKKMGFFRLNGKQNLIFVTNLAGSFLYQEGKSDF